MSKHLSDNDIRYLERGWPDDPPDDYEPFTRDSRWTTKDKRQVPVREMDNKHLINTIRMLCGASPHGTVWTGERSGEWLAVMAEEAFRRGLVVKGQPLIGQLLKLEASNG